MAKRLNEHSAIEDILKEFIRTNGLGGGIDRIDVRNAWKKLMGNGVNTYTQEVMLKGSTLYVALTSAVLREELSYGREKIMKMLNEELGREIIKDIILK